MKDGVQFSASTRSPKMTVSGGGVRGSSEASKPKLSYDVSVSGGK